MELPIDVIPNTVPPKFRWRREVDALGGKRTVVLEGGLPPAVEEAVVQLIGLVRAQEREIEVLRKRLEGSLELVAAQGRKLSGPVSVEADSSAAEVPREAPQARQKRK